MQTHSRRLVMIGRNNRKKTNHPIDLMSQYLLADGYQIEWFKSKALLGIEGRIDWQTRFKATRVGKSLCYWRPLKGLIMEWVKWAYWIRHPNFLVYLLPHHQNNQAIANEINAYLAKLTKQDDTILLCYSAGCIQGSLASIAGGVSQLICFGYPFQHPERPPESARTRHLATLRTPMLILQGDKEAYGSQHLNERYLLSPSIRIESLAADHGYQLSDTETHRAYQLIRQFLNPSSA